VERVVKGPQPLHGIRWGMGVPTATVASCSARPWGWVTTLTLCGTLRQQSACAVKGHVLGAVVDGLDCERSKDRRGLGRSDQGLSSDHELAKKPRSCCFERHATSSTADHGRRQA